MKYLNKIFIMILVFISLSFVGCEDRTELTAPEVSVGDADFSRFVVVGNSLTAGYQNGSLYESSQNYTYSKMIADQVGATFEQPIYSNPGTGRRMEIDGFNPDGTPIIVYNSATGSPQNLNYAAPYNNLGVPGAWLGDALYCTSSTTTVTGQANPMFDLVLRGLGTQLQQAMAQHPTFMIFWLGNNDILGHAAYGGTVPYNPPATFTALYSVIMDSLATTGADVLVANIPYVTSTPYFTTIGPKVGYSLQPAIEAGLAYGLFYQKNGETSAVPPTQFVTHNGLYSGEVMLTLASSAYAAYIGIPSGKFYRDNLPGVDPALLGIDTTQAFGLHPLNPFPDGLVLDEDELANIKSVIDQYNTSISTLAEAKGFHVVDVNSFLSSLARQGLTQNGITFNANYITGNAFSLDGVHPTSRGYALISNLFIDKINEVFNANIPHVDVSKVPNSINFSGYESVKTPTITTEILKNILY